MTEGGQPRYGPPLLGIQDNDYLGDTRGMWKAAMEAAAKRDIPEHGVFPETTITDVFIFPEEDCQGMEE